MVTNIQANKQIKHYIPNIFSLYYAQLSAPTIYEAHCQSALTASAETLASSAQHLTSTYKPLVEDPSRHKIGEELSHCSSELTKALDRLKAAYANFGKSGCMMIHTDEYLSTIGGVLIHYCHSGHC